ncbi:MAG: hypothetical protein RIR18_888 [Pseudomonadota bacterium]|jgi:DNA-binding response OmpR family regulator
MRILLVEDDPVLQSGVKDALTLEKFHVDCVGTGEDAKYSITAVPYDLAIVDIGLPKMSGLDLVRWLRKSEISLPVIITTARDGLDDRIEGLDLGADDYLVKPFQVKELVARVRAVVRRSKSASSSILSLGGVCLNLSTHTSTIYEQPLSLSAREWGVLEQLMLASPNVLTKHKLTETLSSWDSEITSNAVEIYISRLRNKLGDSGVLVTTIRGIGYRLDEI